MTKKSGEVSETEIIHPVHLLSINLCGPLPDVGLNKGTIVYGCYS